MGLKNMIAGALVGATLLTGCSSDDQQERDGFVKEIAQQVASLVRQPPSESTYTVTLPRRDNSGRDIAMDVYSAFAKDMSEQFENVTMQTGTYRCTYDKQYGKMACGETVTFTASRDCPLTICNSDQLKQDGEFINNIAKDYARWLGQKNVQVRKSYEDISLAEGRESKTAHESFIAECEDFSKLTGVKRKNCGAEAQYLTR